MVNPGPQVCQTRALPLSRTARPPESSERSLIDFSVKYCGKESLWTLLCKPDSKAQKRVNKWLAQGHNYWDVTTEVSFYPQDCVATLLPRFGFVKPYSGSEDAQGSRCKRVLCFLCNSFRLACSPCSLACHFHGKPTILAVSKINI